MFDVHRAIKLLDTYSRAGCKTCPTVRECVLKGKVDLSCIHGQAAHEVREFYRTVERRFRAMDAKFLVEVDKTATDGKTQLAFAPGDVFELRGEFSQSQLICREKCPGGKEFLITNKTEGVVWQRIL